MSLLSREIAAHRLMFGHGQILVTLNGRESLSTCFVVYVFSGRSRSLWGQRGLLLALGTLIGAAAGVS